MAEDDRAEPEKITLTTGLCPACGHENQRTWVLCDRCGARLPWAPPPQTRKKIADLSDDELKVLFAPPRQKPAWTFLQDKRVIWAIVTFLSIVLPLIPWLLRR
jgi:hypothetical protein